MSSTTANNKPKNLIHQRSNSDPKPTPTAPSLIQPLKKGQVNNTREEEEEATKRTKKRRPTKIALNDTLRRIRHLIIEGRSNLEIQDILQLEERTFYRYMAKIYEMDRALFAEQEKETLITEIGIFKDRLLKSYRWYIAMADNENINVDIRIKAQHYALDVAYTLVKLEIEGPRLIEEVRRFKEKPYHQNSR
jgi:DNA-binding CsgD family transcriptional regulator